MKLTKRLLSYLHKVFDKDPVQFLALSFSYISDMQWTVSDGFLSTFVAVNSPANLNIDLSQYTLQSLASYIASQSGYTVNYLNQSSQAGSGALVLLDGTGDMSVGLYAYSSVLWSYVEAQSSELETAKAQVANMLQQMTTITAQNEWLDYLGTFYKVPRNPGELDAQYAPRIIATVLRPASNNVALEMAIKAYTGNSAKVTNVVTYGQSEPLYDGTTTHNGTDKYNSSVKPVYGLFDVVYAYDLLNGGDVTGFQATVVNLINQLSAAGTHLRGISLSNSVLSDALNPPTDGAATMPLNVGAAFSDALIPPFENVSTLPISIAPMADQLTTPTDVENLNINYQYTYSGLRSYSGAIEHLGGSAISETP